MPSLHVLDQISDRGSRVNEDIAGSVGGAAWVFDGATGLSRDRLLPADSDARWFVEQLDRALRMSQHSVAVSDLFGAIVERVADLFDRSRLRDSWEKYEVPSAGMAYLRLMGDSLEVARLGDCKVLVETGNYCHALVKSDLDPLDAAVLEEVGRIHQSGTYDMDDVRKLIMGDLQDNRSLMNSPGGYWVMTADKEPVEHIQTTVLPLDSPTRGLLMTDGFYRLVDTFGLMSDQDLIRNAVSGGLAALLSRLREAEELDSKCIAHRRFKQKDDATALLFEVV
jgi:hypothetical protein